jgi:RNA polymerase primary sigma factor
MAKRKERALAKKGMASKRGKTGKKVKSTPRKSAKTSAKKTAQRAAAKTKARKPGIKPRARQVAPKKVSPRPTKSSRRAAAATEETVIVDIVEEAVPGVVVVTEFESVRTSGPEAPSPQSEGGESPDLA